MCCDPETPVVIPKAEWLAELSEHARARGEYARADRLLLLAWMAYDGQAVEVNGVHAAAEFLDQTSSAA